MVTWSEPIGLSFQYLRSLTCFKNELVVEYDTSNKFKDNLEMLSNDIAKVRGPYFMIGHSLGGLYALHLTKHVNVAGAVSISTPFAGSWTADWARFLSLSTNCLEMWVEDLPQLKKRRI